MVWANILVGVKQVQYLVSHWGTDPDSLGCYSYDVVGMAGDLYEKLGAPLGNLFFGGEAVSVEHQGSVHGAYSAGVMAAQNCQSHLLQRLGNLNKVQLISFRNELLESTFPLQISRMWTIHYQLLEKQSVCVLSSFLTRFDPVQWG